MPSLRRACTVCGVEAGVRDLVCAVCGGEVQVHCEAHRAFVAGPHCRACAREAAADWIAAGLDPAAGEAALRRLVRRRRVTSLTEADLARLGVAEPERRAEILAGLAQLTHAERVALGAEPPSVGERLAAAGRGAARWLARASGALARGLVRTVGALARRRTVVLTLLLAALAVAPAVALLQPALVAVRIPQPALRVAACAVVWVLYCVIGTAHLRSARYSAGSRLSVASLAVLSLLLAARPLLGRLGVPDLPEAHRLAPAASAAWLVLAVTVAAFPDFFDRGSAVPGVFAIGAIGAATFAGGYLATGPRILDATGEFALLRALERSASDGLPGPPAAQARPSRIGFQHFVATHLPGGRYAQALPDGRRVAFECVVSSSYRDGVGTVEARGTVAPDGPGDAVERSITASYQLLDPERTDARVPPVAAPEGSPRSQWACVSARGEERTPGRRARLEGADACDLAYTMCRGARAPAAGPFPDGSADPSRDGFEHFAATHLWSQVRPVGEVKYVCSVGQVDFEAGSGRVSAAVEKVEPAPRQRGARAVRAASPRSSRTGTVTVTYRQRRGRWQCDPAQSAVAGAVNGGDWLARPCQAIEEACGR